MATITIGTDQRSVDMGDMDRPNSSHALQMGQNPDAILDECRDIATAIENILSRLKLLEASGRVEESFVHADILNDFRKLASRIKVLKSRPESHHQRNKAQVDRVDRLIRKAIVTHQQSESKLRQKVEDQKRGHLLIVEPDATEDEIKEIISAGVDTQIFQQALLKSNRRGEARSVLSNVHQRRDAIQQIEEEMLELQKIFEDLDSIVKEQEPVVQGLEQKAVDTQKAMERGNAHLDGAIVKARAARRRKWICLGVFVFIMFAVVVVVLIWAAFTGRFVSIQESNF